MADMQVNMPQPLKCWISPELEAMAMLNNPAAHPFEKSKAFQVLQTSHYEYLMSSEYEAHLNQRVMVGDGRTMSLRESNIYIDMRRNASLMAPHRNIFGSAATGALLATGHSAESASKMGELAALGGDIVLARGGQGSASRAFIANASPAPAQNTITSGRQNLISMPNPSATPAPQSSVAAPATSPAPPAIEGLGVPFTIRFPTYQASNGGIRSLQPSRTNPAVRRWHRIDQQSSSSNRDTLMGKGLSLSDPKVLAEMVRRGIKNGTVRYVDEFDLEFLDPHTKDWLPIEYAQMGHIEGASVAWNNRLHPTGARSPQVRAFMLNIDNYRLESAYFNMFDGAVLAPSYKTP
jgi:hypothetical protein